MMNNLNLKSVKVCVFVGSLLLNLNGFGKNYYVSHDGSDNNSGTSPSSPWKSIEKVNTSYFKSGDSILFRKGDVFYGGIIPPNSNMIFSSYGEGKLPIISGYVEVVEWVFDSNNMYYTTIPEGIETNLLTINNRNIGKGRYPNSGFLHHEKVYGNSIIEDFNLKSNPNWTNAEVVIENDHWTLSVNKIKAHTSTRIEFTPSYKGGLKIGDTYGYFFQNNVQTLDLQNEWCQEGNRIYIYSANYEYLKHNNFTISTVPILINLNRRNNIRIENLHLKGANEFGIEVHLCAGTEIRNCEFSNIAIDGVKAASSTTLLIDNCKFLEIAGNGINTNTAKLNATNNQFKNIGLIPGIGGKGGGTFSGIHNTGGSEGTVIKYNKIDSTGYNGISSFRNNFIIQFNNVAFSNSLLNDGGGIYTYLHIVDTSALCYNRIISDNVVSNVILGNGIYSDGLTNNLIIERNTVFDMQTKNGIYCNTPRNNIVRHNTIYNCDGAAIYIHNIDPVVDAWGNQIYENTIFQKSKKNFIKITDDFDNSIYKFGTSNNNVLLAETPEKIEFHIRTNFPWNPMQLPFEKWKEQGHDKTSKLIKVINPELYVNPNTAVKTFLLSNPMIDDSGIKYINSISLEPFESKILYSLPLSTQEIDLKKGWNIFSTYLLPSQKNWEEIISHLIEENTLIKVQNENGKTIERIGDNWINEIGQLDNQYGYKIKVKQESKISIEGYKLDSIPMITLTKGWNIVPYPFSDSMTTKEFLGSLAENNVLVKVIDENGNSIEKNPIENSWLDQIGTIVPGKGYLVNVNKNFILKLND